MAYLKDLLIGRIATETAYGSDYVMTAKLMGVKEMEIVPKMESEAPEVLDGRYAPSNLFVRNKEYGEASITQLLLYEDLPFWLNSAFGKIETTAFAMATDASGILTRTYSAPVVSFATDADTPPTYNLQLEGADGVSSDFWRLTGAYVKSFTVSAESGAVGEIKVDFGGKKVIAASTDALEADRDVIPVMGDHWSLWIDPDTDTIGTSAITAQAFKFELEVDTKRDGLFHLGDLNPCTYKDAGWEGSLALTLQLGAQAQAQMASIITSGTHVKRAIRLKATRGATTALRTFQIDFNGVLLESPTLFTDQDGIVSVELKYQGAYGATLANWLKIVLANAVVTP